MIVSDKLKLKILKELSENSNKEYTHNSLRIKLNISIDSFLNNMKFLEKIGLVETKKGFLEGSKVRANLTKITEEGKKAFDFNKRR